MLFCAFDILVEGGDDLQAPAIEPHLNGTEG